MAMFNSEIECTINENFLEAMNIAIRFGVINFGKNKVIAMSISEIATIVIINDVLLSAAITFGAKLSNA